MSVLADELQVAYARDVAKLQELLRSKQKGKDIRHSLQSSLIDFDARYPNTPTADIVLYEGLRHLPMVGGLFADKVLKQSVNPARAALLAERLADEFKDTPAAQANALYRAVACAHKAGKPKQVKRLVERCMTTAHEFEARNRYKLYKALLKFGEPETASMARSAIFEIAGAKVNDAGLRDAECWLNLVLWQPKKTRGTEMPLDADKAHFLSDVCFHYGTTDKSADMFARIDALKYSLNFATQTRRLQLVGRAARQLETLALDNNPLYGETTIDHKVEALRALAEYPDIELYVGSNNFAERLLDLSTRPGLDSNHRIDVLGFVAYGCTRSPAAQAKAIEWALALALKSETDSLDRKGLLNLVIKCPATPPATQLRAKLYADAANGKALLFHQLATVSTGFAAAVNTPVKTKRRRNPPAPAGEPKPGT